MCMYWSTLTVFLSPSQLYLWFWDRFSHWMCKLTNLAPQGSSYLCPHLPSTVTIGTHWHALLCTWVLGYRTQILMFTWQGHYWLNYLPRSPIFYFKIISFVRLYTIISFPLPSLPPSPLINPSFLSFKFKAAFLINCCYLHMWLGLTFIYLYFYLLKF